MSGGQNSGSNIDRCASTMTVMAHTLCVNNNQICICSNVQLLCALMTTCVPVTVYLSVCLWTVLLNSCLFCNEIRFGAFTVNEYKPIWFELTNRECCRTFRIPILWTVVGISNEQVHRMLHLSIDNAIFFAKVLLTFLYVCHLDMS